MKNLQIAIILSLTNKELANLYIEMSTANYPFSLEYIKPKFTEHLEDYDCWREFQLYVSIEIKNRFINKFK